MRFGELYLSKQNDKYRKHYLNYEYLKNNICNPNFNSLLLVEIDRVECFFMNNKDLDFIFLNFIAILKIIKKYNKNNTEKIDISIIKSVSFYNYLISEKKYTLNNDENDSPCNICYESGSYMLKLSKCEHIICWNCLMKMNDSDFNNCPFCRKKTDTNPIILKYESLTASKCNPQYYESMNIKDNRKRLLFLGIDGLRPDCLLFANTPNLDYLSKNGQINFETIIQNDAISGQSWATIFNGDNNHNILFNEQLEDDNYSPKDNIISVLNSKNINTISITNTWRGIYNLTKNSKEKIYIDKGVLKANDDLVVYNTCEEILKNKSDSFIFSYIGGIDKTGHKYGFSLQKDEYIKYIENFDRSLNILLKLIDEYNYSLIVTTDHGGSYYKDCTKIQENIFRKIPYYAGQIKDKCKGIHGLNIPQHKRTFQIYYGKDYETSETLDTLKNTDIYKNILRYYSI